MKRHFLNVAIALCCLAHPAIGFPKRMGISRLIDARLEGRMKCSKLLVTKQEDVTLAVYQAIITFDRMIDMVQQNATKKESLTRDFETLESAYRRIDSAEPPCMFEMIALENILAALIVLFDIRGLEHEKKILELVELGAQFIRGESTRVELSKVIMEYKLGNSSWRGRQLRMKWNHWMEENTLFPTASKDLEQRRLNLEHWFFFPNQKPLRLYHKKPG